jgi:hypothetical protein
MLRIHPLYAALAALALAACQRQAPAPEASAPAPQPAANAVAAHAFSPDINAADFAELDKTLSSDAFEGRGPGTPGEDKSVEYIKAQMQRIGLKPGNNGEWFQTVPMVETTADPDTTLTFTVDDMSRTLKFGDDMVMGTTTGQAEVNIKDSPLVFEREVKLYVHATAKTGPITGATAVRFDTPTAPQD